MIGIQNRRYLGNKYKLLNFIEDVINNNCPNISSLFDVFAGTGVVAYHFMEKLQVLTNDTLYSNYLAHLAFISNEKIDNKLLKNLIAEFNKINPDNVVDNYMSENFGNTYFSYNDCKIIGEIRERIQKMYELEKINKREYAILTTSLLYAMDRIAYTCGHYDAYRKGVEYQKHIFIDELDLSKKSIKNNLFFNEDSNNLVKKEVFPFVDCAYCDPPYNSRNYCDLYHVLENVARWNKPEVTGVAKKMDRTSLKSKYCSRSATEAFEELVNNLNCKYILLSYNNTGNKANDRSNAKMSDEDIMRILSNKGTVKVFSQKYKAFSTGKSDNTRNEERLFVCTVDR